MVELASVYEVGTCERVYPSTKLTCALDALARRDIDYQPILSELGMTHDELTNGEQKISIDDLLLALSMVTKMCRDPDLPYEMGTNMHLTDYGMYGFALLSCRTFKDMMYFADKYHNLATPINVLKFVSEPERTGWIVDPITHPLVQNTLYQFITIFQLSAIASLHRDVKGPNFAPEKLEIAFYPSSPYRLPKFGFCCDIEYGTSQTFMHISPKWFDVRPNLASGSTFEYVKEMCEDSLIELNEKLGEVAKVRKAIMSRVADPPTLEEIADDLAMTARTLRRRMAEQNKSYRDLRDEILAATAIQYSRENVLSNDEIAYLLGFADAASLRRAFRRWTGKRPSDFRKS